MSEASSDAVTTIGELAKYVKISPSTLYKLAEEGRLLDQKVADTGDFTWTLSMHG